MARYMQAVLLLVLGYVAQGFVIPAHVRRPHIMNVAQQSAGQLSMSIAPAIRTEPYIADAEQLKRPSRVKQIKTHDNFLEAMAGNSDRPVVIKFYDTHCRACKAVAPKFERMAQDNPGVSFYEIEFSQSKPLCKSLGIKVLPTVQIYQGAEGKIADMPVGPKRFHTAEEALERVLNKGNNGSLHIPN